MAKTIPMRWQTLADTPKTVDALKGQHAEINGCSLYYAMAAQVRKLSSYCMGVWQIQIIGVFKPLF